MTGLLLGVLAGALVIFVLPSVLPAAYRSALAASLARVLGIGIILFAVLSTSFMIVPDGHVGQLFRVYGGGPLKGGRILAVEGENGPQARTVPPGFQFWLLVNVLYNVDTTNREVNIPKGKVGVLTAKDGAPLRPGQAFADPFSTALGYGMLDAEVFLTRNGQRGPQLSVLTPGRYRLNRYLWDVVMADAREVEAGYVGVVKSNIHADIDFGTLKADKPGNCDVIRLTSAADRARLDAPIVPVGCIGVWDKPLQPGKYYFNPDAFGLTQIDTRAQVWTYSGGYRRANISLTVDAKGEIVQNRTEVDVAVERDSADRAVFVKMEGWDVPLELRVVAQVSPNEAACVVAAVGSLKQVEDRVLTPSIRAITRDVAGGSYEITEPRLGVDGRPTLDADGKPVFVTINRPTKVLDLINQRPLIEGEIERRIRPEALKSCVTIREVRLGEPAIPPELLVAVRREQLAIQLARAFVQEKMAQDQRVTSEKAKATADQQFKLVESEINVQRSVQNAQAARNEGQGERDKLSLISEGQQKQVGVLGPEATVRLRQFELMLDSISKFANANPQVLTTAIANAQKFVPNVQVGGGDAGSGIAGMLMGILGQSLNASPGAQSDAATTTPRTGTVQRR